MNVINALVKENIYIYSYYNLLQINLLILKFGSQPNDEYILKNDKCFGKVIDMKQNLRTNLTWCAITAQENF